MKQKTLVIVLGQARADRLTWPSFQKYVLHELEADLALCIGESPENNESNFYWANSKFNWVVPEYDDFGEGFDQIQSDRYGEITDWRAVLKVKDQWLGGIKGPEAHPGSAGLLVYFKAKLYEILVKENIIDRYDRFVITRSDFIWEMPHPKIERLDPSGIWIPYGEFYWGVTDRHVILSREYLKGYLDLIDPILKDTPKLIHNMLAFNPKPNWNHEQYILFHLKSLNLARRIRFLPYMMYSVREKSTPTRWSQGEFDPSLGFFVKYPAEKTRAELTKKYLVDRSGKVILLSKFLMNPVLKGLFSLKVRNMIR
jgi:hypothetical protein